MLLDWLIALLDGDARVRDLMSWKIAAALGRGIYSASNRNECQKQKNNGSGEQSGAGAQGWQNYRYL
jgi:hypothetical protein